MDWMCTILTAANEAESKNGALTDMVGALDIFLMVMLLACGVYAIYTVIRLRRSYYLEPNKILYPTDCSPENCLDSDGFIDYILPRMTALGIAMVLQGIVLVVNSYVLRLKTTWIDIPMIVLPVATFGYYVVIMRKAAKRFWSI